MLSNSKTIMTDRHFGSIPKAKILRMYFTRKAKIKIHNELGFGELYLLEYWLEATGNPNSYVISDRKTAKALGIKERSIKKYRIALQNANLFRVIKTTNKNIRHLIYCFGKEGVYTACYFPDIFGFNLNSISGVMSRFSIDKIKKLLDVADITPHERKDMYELFDAKYRGQFYYEEVA